MIPGMMLVGQRRGAAAGGGGATGLKAGLVSWYDFDDASGMTWVDSHGPNDLTFVFGTGGVSESGVAGNAMRKPSGWYLHAAQAGLAFLSGSFTVAMWIKAGNGNQSGVGIYDVSAPNNRKYLVLLEGGAAKFAVSTDGNSNAAIVQDGSGLNDINWHLLIGWRSVTDEKIYIQVDNGTPVGVAFSAAASIYDNAALPLQVGNLGNGGYYDVARYDSTGLWSRELDSTERTALWNGGAGLAYADL